MLRIAFSCCVSLLLLGDAAAMIHLRHNLHEVTDLLPKSGNATTYFYEQAQLDHFTPNPAHWSQRYYTDETFWGGEGFPIFLMIGGEGPERAPSEHFYMATLAEKHQAMMVSLEHRFYGESFPTPDMSNANLVYLTSEQALADLARFISYVTSYTHTTADTSSSPALTLMASTTKSQVVTFGGSYPGSLAAWVGLKYPQLIAGTVASSAPVYAEYDYSQYAEVVGAALGYEEIGGSKQCVETIKSGIVQLAALVRSSQPMGTASDIPSALRPCAPITTELDLATYEANVFGNFQGAVQYNGEQPSAPTVMTICEAITGGVTGGANLSGASKAGDDALQRLASATALFTDPKAPFDKRCLSQNFTDTVTDLANATFSGAGCDTACSSDRQVERLRVLAYSRTTTWREWPRER
jgi:serine protease 16